MSDITKTRAGRPTDYTDEMYDKAIEYITQFKEIEIHNAAKSEVPSIVGLALYLGVARSTLYVWREEYPVFKDMLELLKEMQEHELINNGLNGSFNTVIVKLMLAKHGYADKVETDNTNNNSGAQQIVYIDGSEKNGLEKHINDIVGDADADKTS